MINASGCDAQFEQHRKVRLIDEKYCSCMSILVFHVDLCGRAVRDFDGSLHADTNDSHRRSFIPVVRNPGQLDRKHTRLDLSCSVRLFRAILRATWLGSDLCR